MAMLKTTTAVWVIILTFFSAHADNQPNPDNPDNLASRAMLTVTVSLPTYSQVKQQIEASGTIEAREIAQITAQVSGLSLNRILVDVGDNVKKNQVLALYDADSVHNDIAQAKAALKQAQIAHEQALKNANRAKRLRKTQAISALELDNFIFQEKQAKAQIDAAKAVFNNQNLRASYAKVKANTAGLIIQKQAVLGAIGNPGTPLFSIIVNNEMEWQADVPSHILSSIAINSPVEVNLGKQQKIAGKVRKIDPNIDARTRQGKVYVSMQPHEGVRRGLFVRGVFLLGENNRLVIPASCLFHADGFDYVFVVGKDNHVLRKKVQLGEVIGDKVIVTQGLSLSERVVDSGVGFLHTGDLVNVVLKPKEMK